MKTAPLKDRKHITAADLLKHIDSMPVRMAAVIAADGGDTHW